MKKIILLIICLITIQGGMYAGQLRGDSPLGGFIIDDPALDDVIFEEEYCVRCGTDGFTSLMYSGGGSFPVYYHTGSGSGSFTLNFGPGTTMDDIIGALCGLFGLTSPLIIIR